MDNYIKILPELNESISKIKEISGNSSDVLINRFLAGGIECALICCEGMFSSQTMGKLVFDPVTKIPVQKNSYELFRYIQKNTLFSADRPAVSDYNTLFRLINSGFAVIIADGINSALAFGIQGYAVRSVQEPSGEGNIMGSHEGFTETVRTNMSLIRRRIKSPDLVMKLIVKGTKSHTDICICYMKDRVPPQLLEDIEKSLDNIKLESILSTGYIRPFLEKKHFEFFNSTGTTERPDVLCAKLIEGRIAILIDGVPFAVTVPKLLCESFQTLDDYAVKPYYAVFVRWLKYLAFITAVFLPAVYIAIIMYHPELLNSTLLILLAEAEKDAPLSVVTEALFVLIMYEIIREAGVRIPKPTGGAVSIISGLIIGDAAVKSGLVSTPLLTIMVLAVLGGLAVPDLNPQITVLRFLFLISGAVFGLFGISVFACAVLVNVCATETYGFPYTAPVSPFKMKGLEDTVFRINIPEMQNRGFTVEEYHE